MARLTAFGGVEEIGGNRLLLEDRGRILLDFGLSFDAQNRFFHEYLSPRKLNGLGDWVRMGQAPQLDGVYRQDYRDRSGLPEEPRGVDGVLLSHAHLDHAGLFPLLRPDIPIHLSEGARIVLETLQTTGAASGDYLEYFEEFRLRANAKGGLSKTDRRVEQPVARPIVHEAHRDVASFDVNAFAVDHSLPGARGYVIEASQGTVGYTGDFRFHGRHGEASARFAKKLGGVDVLVTEGTNMGDENPDDRTAELPGPLSEEAVRDRIAEVVAAAGGFVGVNYPARDLDRILSFWEAARKADRRLLLTTKQAWMLNRFHEAGFEVPSLDDRHLGVYLQRRGWGLLWGPGAKDPPRNLLDAEYKPWERPFLDHVNARTAVDVREEPEAFMVYVDLFNMTELVDIGPDPGGIYVFSKTEAFNEEMDIDLKRLGRWLEHFGLKEVKAHASGHASREELESMIDSAGPRRIVPVHTHNVKAFEETFGPRVTRLRVGQGVDL